jgi:hypothetical protein
MRFAELSQKAKDTALDWMRCCEGEDFDGQGVIEMFIEDWKKIGLEVTPAEVYWSGFYMQGSGASFQGHYYYIENAPMMCAGDNKLFEAAVALEKIRRRLGTDQFNAHIATGRGNYCHSGCMEIEIEIFDTLEGVVEIAEHGLAQLEIAMRDVFRGLADDLYRALEAEYDWLTDDEQLIERIECNEYDFDEEGNVQ